MTSVLFICMGNICRSPALEATLRHLAIAQNCADQLKIDSCAVGWLHIGEHPDPRTFETAMKRGILIDHLAQQFRDHFLDEFDYLFVVDRDIAEQIKFHAISDQQKKKVMLASAFSQRFKDQDIPDPYYLNHSGFEQVMDMIVDCAEAILRHLTKR
jgi:protein-tyrosine phosphatase